MSELIDLPPTFVGYPGENPDGDSGLRLVQALRAQGVAVYDWQDASEPNFLWSGESGVKAAIDKSGLALLETTSGNGNVLFEFGYAIGSNRHVYSLHDSTRADGMRLRVLDTVRQIRYSARRDIIEELRSFQPGGATLLDEVGWSSQQTPDPRTVFFLPAPNTHDLSGTIYSAIQRLRFLRSARIDTDDADYNNIRTLTYAIGSAATYVGLLVHEGIHDADRSNAHSMLFAGIAAGLGRKYVVLAPRDGKRLLDLEDNILFYDSETEAEERLRRWLEDAVSAALGAGDVTAQRPVSTKPEDRQEPVFLGSGDAGADFELADYFVNTPEFVQARNAEKRIFVGAKGSGKTANFKMLSAEFRDTSRLLVDLQPTEWQFPELAAVFEEQIPFAHWRFVYGSFWRFIILSEVVAKIRQDFWPEILMDAGSDSAEARRLQTQASRTRSRPATPQYSTAIKNWAEENEHLLALDFASRVSRLLEDLSESARADDQAAMREKLQIARLYGLERDIREFARHHEIRFIADDLDRNWEPSSDEAFRLVTSLLNAVSDVTSNFDSDFKATLFIRRDLYDYLMIHDPEFGRRDVGILRWSTELLGEVVAARLRARGVASGETAEVWSQTFPIWTQEELTSEFIATRSLHRPRQMIHFCQEAIAAAARELEERVLDRHINEAWSDTGQLILGELVAEHRFKYPGLDGVLLELFGEFPVSCPMSTLQSRIGALSNRPDWLTIESAGGRDNVAVFYDLQVLGVTGRGGALYYKQDRPWESVRPVLDEDFEVVVHPAFQRYFGALVHE